jgi:Ca2+-binding RTX toxin-like protein
VRLYRNAECSGEPAATGSAAKLGNPGIPVSVAEDRTTRITATATNPGGDESACSDPILYSESPPCRGAPATQIGSAHSDSIVGTSGRDVIVGLGGDDTIRALRGDDIVCSGPGDDTVLGADGDDALAGGSGEDLLAGGTGDDRLYGGPGTDHLDGGPGQNHLVQ